MSLFKFKAGDPSRSWRCSACGSMVLCSEYHSHKEMHLKRIGRTSEEAWLELLRYGHSEPPELAQYYIDALVAKGKGTGDELRQKWETARVRATSEGRDLDSAYISLIFHKLLEENSGT